MSTLSILEEAKILLDKAKTDFIIEEPKSVFLNSIMCSIPVKFVDDIPTLCVNPLLMKINPTFFKNNLSNKTRKGAIAHELLHLAFKHCLESRKGERDLRVWQFAADFTVNSFLKKHGYSLEPGWLYKEEFDNLSTEEIYDKLMANVQWMPAENPQEGDFEICSGKSSGEGDEDSQNKGSGYSPQGAPIDVEDTLNKILLRAAIQSEIAGEKNIGNLPGEIYRTLHEIRHPKMPWQIILMEFLMDKLNEDYTFQKPNKRYSPDIILPTLYSEGMGKIAFICDTSGSITQEEFEEFYSEAITARELLNPAECLIASFDTELYLSQRLHRYEHMQPYELEGGGGTDIYPVLNFINQEEPDITVIFTDGYFYYRNDHEPKSPVLWLIKRNPDFQISFGKIIEFV